MVNGYWRRMKRDDEVHEDMKDENVVKEDQDDENMGGDLKRDGGTG